MKPKPLPSQERLKELFDYDPETGNLTRKIKTSNAIKAGDVVGSVHRTAGVPSGYLTMWLDGYAYLLHRVIWKWVHGTDPSLTIDHKDGVKNNNRIQNLREATHGENTYNTPSHSPSKYGRGVHKKGNRFEVYVRKEGRTTFGGSFRTATQAFLVACDLRNKLHGEFANHC